MKTRGATLLAVLAVALAGAATATATPPVRTAVTATVPSGVVQSLTGSCGFTVLGSSTVSFRTTRFVDEDGTIVRQTTHGAIDGILVRESTGSTLATKAHWTETRDFVEGTAWFSGLRFSVQAAGQPPREVTVGHLVDGGSGVLDPAHATPRFSFPLLSAEVGSGF